MARMHVRFPHGSHRDRAAADGAASSTLYATQITLTECTPPPRAQPPHRVKGRLAWVHVHPAPQVVRVVLHPDVVGVVVHVARVQARGAQQQEEGVGPLPAPGRGGVGLVWCGLIGVLRAQHAVHACKPHGPQTHAWMCACTHACRQHAPASPRLQQLLRVRVPREPRHSTTPGRAGVRLDPRRPMRQVFRQRLQHAARLCRAAARPAWLGAALGCVSIGVGAGGLVHASRRPAPLTGTRPPKAKRTTQDMKLDLNHSAMFCTNRSVSLRSSCSPRSLLSSTVARASCRRRSSGSTANAAVCASASSACALLLCGVRAGSQPLIVQEGSCSTRACIHATMQQR